MCEFVPNTKHFAATPIEHIIRASFRICKSSSVFLHTLFFYFIRRGISKHVLKYNLVPDCDLGRTEQKLLLRNVKSTIASYNLTWPRRGRRVTGCWIYHNVHESFLLHSYFIGECRRVLSWFMIIFFWSSHESLL